MGVLVVVRKTLEKLKEEEFILLLLKVPGHHDNQHIEAGRTSELWALSFSSLCTPYSQTKG